VFDCSDITVGLYTL